LSCIHNISPSCLHAYIVKNFYSQVPATFHIMQLPQEISSWLISWLQKNKELKEWGKEQQTKKREHGKDGVSTAPSSKMTTTYTYRICPRNSEQDFSAPSPHHSEGDSFLDQTKTLWEQAQSKRSWQIFKANVGYNPAHGILDNRMHPSLARQVKGMKNNDPGEKKQKALPVCIYREIYRQAQSPLDDSQDKTIAWLQVLAFFFCMQSCEY
jgi:hypothetical protein